MKAPDRAKDRALREEFLIFGSPSIDEDEIAEVVSTLRSGWLGTGPKVARFEELFREYTGAKYAIAVSSCTAALHLSLLAAGIGDGDEVITTPMTFAATANSIVHTGAFPRFVDIDRETMLIDPAAIDAYLQRHCFVDTQTGSPVNRQTRRKVRAIIPVHLAGRPCAMDRIMDIASRYNLYVIEDAAHAIEAEYKGRKVGAIGDFSCFSFYVTKNLVTGEGGMITTNSEESARYIKKSSLHGLSADAWERYGSEGCRDYEVLCPGFKYNMTDMQASLGIHQIRKLAGNLKRRQEIWQVYDQAFADLPLTTPAPIAPDMVHARHLYNLLVDKEYSWGLSRDGMRQALHHKKIGTGIHYTALHLHSYYKNSMGYRVGDFPNAEYISARTLSLPLTPHLSDRDIEDVVEAVHSVLQVRI